MENKTYGERVSGLILFILLVVCLSLDIAGCRSGSSSMGKLPTTTRVPAVAFSSARVYDNVIPTVHTLGRLTALAKLHNSNSNIWVVTLDGSGIKPLTLPAMSTESSNLVCSPDGSKIAFDSRRALDGSDKANANDTSNIWVMNADGSGTRPLTQLTAKGADSFGAVWSPDGTKIAYSAKRSLDKTDNANTNGTSNIWVVNADGSNAKALTQTTAQGADNDKPDWSRDGKKIVFDSRRALDGSDKVNANNTSNIWVMNANGSDTRPLTQLTAKGADSFRAVWSPDDGRIAFESSRAFDGSNIGDGLSSNIWVVNADGSDARALTYTTASVVTSKGPAWSPDGSRIAFESNRALNGSNGLNTNETINIWIMNADGSGTKPLTQFTAILADSLWPNWSPDSSKILFASGRTLNGSDNENTNATFNVWIMNADGSGATPLTQQ